jgi:hypothetical protein
VRLRLTIPLLSSLVATTVVALGAGSTVDAADYSLTVDRPVHIGIDAIGGRSAPGYDITPCQLDGGPGRINFSVNTAASNVRVEMYPGAKCGPYTGWESIGGVHIEAGARSRDLGHIVMPVDGQGGAFALRGAILSSSPIGDGRLSVDAFQIPTAYPEAPAPLQTNGLAVSTERSHRHSSRGATWSGGVGWRAVHPVRRPTPQPARRSRRPPTSPPGRSPRSTSTRSASASRTATTRPAAPAPRPARSIRPRRRASSTPDASSASPTGTPGRRSPPDAGSDHATRRGANRETQGDGLASGSPSRAVSAVLLNVTADHGAAAGPSYVSVVPQAAGVLRRHGGSRPGDTAHGA